METLMECGKKTKKMKKSLSRIAQGGTRKASLERGS